MDLARAIEAAERLVERLGERLNPVLQAPAIIPAPPALGTEAPIRSLRFKAEALAGRLVQLLERVDL
jgi:hypothetical protein